MRNKDLQLPYATNDGLMFKVIRIDNSLNLVRVLTQVGETINGLSSYDIPAQNHEDIVSFSGNWFA